MSNILLWPYHVSLISKTNVFLLINISAYHASWFTPVTFPIITKEIVFDLLPNVCESLIGRGFLEVPFRAITQKSPAKVHIKTFSFPTDKAWDFGFLETRKFIIHRITIYSQSCDVPRYIYQTIIQANKRLEPDITVELNGHGPIRNQKDIPISRSKIFPSTHRGWIV